MILLVRKIFLMVRKQRLVLWYSYLIGIDVVINAFWFSNLMKFDFFNV